MNSQSIPSIAGRTVRFVLCSTALWAGLSPVAFANIITRHIDVTLNAVNIESYDLDVNLDGITDFTFTAALALDPALSVGFDVVNFRFGSNNGVVIDLPTGNGFPTVSRLQAGNTISASATYSGPNDQGNLFFFTTFDSPSGNFGGQTGYLGLRFDSGSGTEYGFAELTVNDLNAPNNPLGLTIGMIGFNDAPGQSVQIRAIPAPTSLALFGIGLFGFIAGVRRRRISTSNVRTLFTSC